jgi:alkylated DNA nucleotide flippase Atl1
LQKEILRFNIHGGRRPCVRVVNQHGRITAQSVVKKGEDPQEVRKRLIKRELDTGGWIQSVDDEELDRPLEWPEGE